MVEVRKAAHRLNYGGILRTLILGHAWITGAISQPILRMDTGKIGNRYLFSKLFKVELNYREEDQVLDNSGDLVWYIEGYKMEEDSDAGVYGLRQYMAFVSLGTVFPEVMAINICVQRNMR